MIPSSWNTRIRSNSLADARGCRLFAIVLNLRRRGLIRMAHLSDLYRQWRALTRSQSGAEPNQENCRSSSPRLKLVIIGMSSKDLCLRRPPTLLARAERVIELGGGNSSSLSGCSSQVCRSRRGRSRRRCRWADFLHALVRAIWDERCAIRQVLKNKAMSRGKSLDRVTAVRKALCRLASLAAIWVTASASVLLAMGGHRPGASAMRPTSGRSPIIFVSGRRPFNRPGAAQIGSSGNVNRVKPDPSAL